MSEDQKRDAWRGKANKQPIEDLLEGTGMDIREWLRTPKSKTALSRCEVAGVTPQQVENPETLLPHAARVSLRLCQWLQRGVAHVERAILRNHPVYENALAIQASVARENRILMLQLIAKQREIQKRLRGVKVDAIDHQP